MALNVEQIENRLAMMQDAELQKYAAMNKNDPYIVSLAVSESNRRKKVRQAQQGMQGQMPQPKVVDAAVQGMAAPMPEAVGIGQLPAGPMNFADGGIVAFADGGGVERYADQGLVRNPLAFLSPSDLWSGAGRIFSEGIDPVAAEYRRQAALRKLVAPAEETVGTSEFSAAQEALKKKAEAEGTALPSDAAAKADTTSRIPPATPALPTTTAGLPAMQDLAKLRQNIAGQQNFVDPAKAETEALGLEMLAGAERRKKAFEDYTAKQGDIYKSREERLAKRESEVESMGDKNVGLALLQAGAAMMSTPGSLGVAVGKAIDTGSKNYAAGIDKIRAAQERLSDARDKMEELRLNRDDMTFKQQAAYEADIDKAKVDAKKLGIDGIRLAADVNEKRASDIFGKTVDLAKTQYEQAGANARANAQIAATLSTPERQMWNQALAKHAGDTAAAFKELQAAKAEKFNPYQSYADYLKAFAGKENVLTAPMDFATYASQFSVPTVKAPPQNATVRTLPGG